MAHAEGSAPSSESVLVNLTQQRILDLGRKFGIGLRGGRDTKKNMAATLGGLLSEQLPAVLDELGRDELRLACRAHGLSDTGLARHELQSRLLEAAGISLDPDTDSDQPVPRRADGLPQPGQMVLARHRQWLVEDVIPGAPDSNGTGTGNESALVKLVCLDDDAPGRELDILWDLELGARVLAPETHGLGTVSKLDPPGHFGAYLHALKWSAVSAADPNRFQAPFRAGIKLMAHQLTPLMKALELPRANLFIADDVGLGKTIEAGLVLQELLLRQQADFVLVICPASVCLQWRDEMQRRFGLHFQVMTRQFVAYRRRDRGFGVNAWATHNRFIVSHPLIRRPEYRDPLLAHLGPRARKGLLILDEAHVAAPASASKYAVDSDITRTIRDLAPRFDNRLFLSATPHNGHSNSFSALLEILDPNRFTRGVPVSGRSALAPVMVRRLKRDLRQLGVERFPRRLLVQLALRHSPEGWGAEEVSFDAETGTQTKGPTTQLGSPAVMAGDRPAELALAENLARYTELCAPPRGRGRLVFINLQKRLLSSPEAFARTLDVHARAVEKRGGPIVRAVQASLPLQADDADPDTHGVDDDALAAEEDAAITAASALLPSPSEEAATLLSEMRALAEKSRRAPDAKVLALLAWMRAYQCPTIGMAPDSDANTQWSDRRVILFTEYGDTKRYLLDLIEQAIAHTDDAEQRILVFHGGMGDDARDEVQRAFNTPPADHPVRILVATDAAREGVNLQAHCADLFHIDVPWNPARLDQRNGRIDRTLQEADEVRCHYFVYPDRTEDRVLQTLVRKIETVRHELGSLGAVLLDDMEKTLAGGIGQKTGDRLEAVGNDANTTTAQAELEDQRKDLDALQREIHQAGRRLDASKKALQVTPDSLRGVVEIGLRLAGAVGLQESEPTSDDRRTFQLPALDRSWDRTLDSLRPPRQRGEPFWEWRQKPPRPVTFEPLARLTQEAEQLHLAHPFIKRILDRFLAQGFSAHDLSRVASVIAPDDSVVRVVAYARLSLFGPGAARLHDEILAVAAPWSASRSSKSAKSAKFADDPEDLAPYRDAATEAKAISQVETLLAGDAKPPPAIVAKRIAASGPQLFASLWSSLEAEADARAVAAKNGLAQRARRESDELRQILESQKKAIDKAAGNLRQGELFAPADTDSATLREQKRQARLDLEHMDKRLGALDAELASEPEAIAALYDVRMTRLSPIGLVVSWPEALT